MILGSFFVAKPMYFTVKSILSWQHVEKGKVLTAKSITFRWKSIPKPYVKYTENFYFFDFMLQMYFLVLVSTESVWERFGDPTDPKKCGNSHYISPNPL